MHDPWRLYDELIDGIPETVRAADCLAGISWTYVRSDQGGMGLAHTVKENSRPFQYKGGFQDVPLKFLANCLRSWNLVEASIGMAAVNAWYNTEDKLARLGARAVGKDGEVFSTRTDRLKGKKVAVIGHFPDIERQFRSQCELTVLERDPQKGDFPDSACEYLLPAQDAVYITGMALVNKTLPRLLELSARAEVFLVGPSVPLAPALFAYGPRRLSGYCVTDPRLTEDIVRSGGKREVFVGGKKFELTS